MVIELCSSLDKSRTKDSQGFTGFNAEGSYIYRESRQRETVKHTKSSILHCVCDAMFLITYLLF